ncbi:MAG: carboxylesterase family protein [Pseudomonadota bacterium]
MLVLIRRVAVMLLLAAGPSAHAQIVEIPIAGDPVATDAGMITGLTLPSGVKAYLGIPFAAPPLRELRWQAPQPVKPWRGVYHADRKAPECIQVLRAHNINHYFGEEATSEDCLYLNLWLPPGAKAADKLPVIVYLYGGGNTIGSSGMALYGGEGVAAAGAVFVNLNYRLGALGFMAHPQLSAESPTHSSGNYAYLDQIAALQWIQRNIGRFGGDPAQVIVTGQSAGAMSASLLQSSPLARGLFRGVVGMSGSAFGLGAENPPTLAQAEKTGLEVQAALKAKDLDGLRQLPADRILSVQQDCQLGCSGSIRIGGANVDGHLLPAAPAELFASKRHNDVPVITGFMRDENSNDLSTAGSLQAYRDAAARLYGASAPELLQLYPAATDAQARVAGRNAARDGGMFTQAVHNWALAQGRWSRSPVYLYTFARVHPFNPAVVIADHPEAIGAYHTSDVPFWLQTQDALNLFRPTRLWTPADRQFAAEMTRSLIAFARTGSPRTAALPWTAWRSDNEQLLELGDSAVMKPLDGRRLEFHRLHPPSAPTQPAARGPRD